MTSNFLSESTHSWLIVSIWILKDFRKSASSHWFINMKAQYICSARFSCNSTTVPVKWLLEMKWRKRKSLVISIVMALNSSLLVNVKNWFHFRFFSFQTLSEQNFYSTRKKIWRNLFIRNYKIQKSEKAISQE